MKKLVAFFLLIALFHSCQSNKEEVPEFLLFPIATEVIDSCYLFELINADDSCLIASLLQSSSQLVSIPIDNYGLNLSKSDFFLNKGRGNLEILSGRFDVYHDTLHVLSTTSNGIDKVIEIPLNHTDDASFWNVVKTPYFQTVYPGLNVNVLKDGLYLFSGGYIGSESVACYANIENGVINELDYWPEDGVAVNSVVKHQMYTSESKVFWNEGKILYVCGNGCFALLLDHNTQEVTYLYDEYPKYSEANDGLNFIKEPKCSLGMYSFTSQNSIYLAPILSKIVNGDYQPDNFKGYPPYYTDRIDVFSWEGKKLGTLSLANPFSNFIVNEQARKLFALSENLITFEQEVHIYDLSLLDFN